MNRTTTAWLAVAALILLAFIVGVERRGEPTWERQDRARRALQIRPETVSRIRIESGALTIECARDGSSWRITYPIQVRADAGGIDRILNGLSDLPRGEVISESQRAKSGLTIEDYGLAFPRARFSFDDGRFTKSFLVGRDAPLGGSLYVQEVGGTDVVAMDTNLLALIPASVDELRDRVLFPSPLDEVRRLEIRRADGFVQLMKTEPGDWRLQQPVSARADLNTVQGLLAQLLALRVDRFVSDAPADPAAYGLEDEAAVRVLVSTGLREMTQELLLGKASEQAPGTVYARLRSGPSVVLVTNSILPALAVKPDGLRDRRIVPLPVLEMARIRIEQGERFLELHSAPNTGWWIVSPRQCKADDRLVQEWLTRWTAFRADLFAPPETNPPPFDAPVLHLSRHAASTSGTGAIAFDAPDDVTLVFAGPSTNPGLARVSIPAESSVVEVMEAVAGEFVLDPLRFRDRQVLALEPDLVTRVSLSREGWTQSVERADTGEFLPVPVAAGEVDPAAVDALLSLLRDLRAERFAGENPTNLAPYGLDAPSAVFELGLKSPAGLGKALLIGGSAGGGERYAMMRGQDEVMVLDESTCARFPHRLWKEPAVSTRESLDAPPSNNPIGP